MLDQLASQIKLGDRTVWIKPSDRLVWVDWQAGLVLCVLDHSGEIWYIYGELLQLCNSYTPVNVTTCHKIINEEMFDTFVVDCYVYKSNHTY